MSSRSITDADRDGGRKLARLRRRRVKALPALGDPTATEPAPSQQRPARSGHQSPQRRTDGYRLDAPRRRGPRGNADPGRTQKNDNIERVKRPKALIENLDFVNPLERFGQAADRAPPLRNQKVADSPLEGTGFELPVRGCDESGFRSFCVSRQRERDRKFVDSPLEEAGFELFVPQGISASPS